MIYDLILMILSTFRIVMLFTEDRGPFKVFEKFRERVGIFEVEDEDGNINKVTDEDNELGYLFSCVWCLSIYIGTVVMLLPKIVQIPLAISGAVILLRKYID